MHADVGDRLHIHSRAVGIVDREGEVIEVHGDQGEPRTWSGSTTVRRR